MISLLVHRTATHTDQYLHYSSYHQTIYKESVVSSFNRVYFIISSKYYLTKENAKIKQMLKKNGYQESIISKIFKGCVGYVVASFVASLKEQFLKAEKMFFHPESSLHFWGNQILTFQIFKCYDVIKCLNMKHETHAE